VLIEITVKMEGLDRNIGSLDRTLEQAPKVFDAIRVNDLLAHILNGVIEDFVLIVLAEAAIGDPSVGEEARALLDRRFLEDRYRRCALRDDAVAR
jgi:hypothetical protein